MPDISETHRYPTQEELNRIENWDVLTEGGTLLMEYVRTLWHIPEWGWKQTQRRFYISTGGWLGNEDLIDALQHNHLFWSLTWLQTRNGGHYVLDRAPMRVWDGWARDKKRESRT